MNLTGAPLGTHSVADAQRFADAFFKLTGHTPFRWQRRLFEEWFAVGRIPTACDIPTGLGKTSVMAIWYLALKSGATVPRRLVYVVDRRAVVDQATTVADQIKAKSSDNALRVSTLRGQYADNREWLEDPAAPAIIVGTVDMIGSRLLFSGYGVSRKMRSYQAGLLGADTLLVLDESHLVPPFEELMKSIANDSAAFGPRDALDREVVPPFNLLSLSATARKHDDQVFRLREEDFAEEPVRKRLGAEKRVMTVETSRGKLDVALAEESWKLAEKAGQPIRCLVYCNSREVAEKVRDALAKRGKDEVETELFVGARRVKERVDAAERLKALGFLAGSDVELEKPAFLVATSAGEVGVDLDADHMVCDLAPWERMVQRLGRVNRRGDGNAHVVVVHEGEPKPKKPDEPKPDELPALIAWRSLALLGRLPRNEWGHDASPAALVALKTGCANDIEMATTPEPLRPAFTRALADAWSMTSLEVHTGRPEVAPWLRGWIEDTPQTTLVWRTHLPVRTKGDEATDQEIETFFEAAPPHLTERLETETWRVTKWLAARAEKLMDVVAKGDGSPHKEAPRPPLAGKDGIVAFALDQSGHCKRTYRLEDLRSDGNAKTRTLALERTLRNVTLVVDARLGGLGAAGLLDDAEDDALTADDDTAWKEVGFRIEDVSADRENERHRERVRPFYFALERNDEGEDVRLLVVEKVPGESKSEEDRALSAQPQLLAAHQDSVAAKARAIAGALGLGADVAGALEIAARLHDEGKRAKRWQQAFNAPADGIYAKTKGPVKFGLLGGYRHEFGSLFHAEKDEKLKNLSAESQDLVLHIIAAHHGRARPVIETTGCEDMPPSALEGRARDVALRFARLQKRWGPWGLAWWEALLRAADQQASRANDKVDESDG